MKGSLFSIGIDLGTTNSALSFTRVDDEYATSQLFEISQWQTATTQAAQKHMTGVKRRLYPPVRANVRVYKELYDLYRRLHDAFGTEGYRWALGVIMEDVIRIRDRARRSRS